MLSLDSHESHNPDSMDTQIAKDIESSNKKLKSMVIDESDDEMRRKKMIETKNRM